MRNFLIAAFCLFLLAVPASAQTPPAADDGARPPERVTRPMIAVDPVTLQGEGLRIRLWGIKPAQTAEVPLELKALDLMDAMIGNEPVNCKVMGGRLPDIYARCASHAGQDLGLELLSSGLAVIDRRQTYNTVFASSYATAQETARLAARGVWNFVREDAGHDSSMPKWLAPYMGVILPIALLFGPLAGLAIIAFVVRTGFSQLGLRQEKDMEDTRRKEAGLQMRERQVLVSTLEGEVVENKNKIDAFLVIYNDMLRDLKNGDSTPKYQQVGDIVQKHPGFSRIVFDASVGKLSLLDIKTAGLVSKFYAALPTDQEYINLEPDVPLDTAIKLVEKVTHAAEALIPDVEQTIRALQAAAAQKG